MTNQPDVPDGLSVKAPLETVCKRLGALKKHSAGGWRNFPSAVFALLLMNSSSEMNLML